MRLGREDENIGAEWGGEIKRVDRFTECGRGRRKE